MTLLRYRSCWVGLACAAALSSPGAARADATLEAKLVDAKATAHGSAAIQAAVSGIELVDPASVQEKPHAGQGHLHYRIDAGPVVATPSTKLSLHELAPGPHRIEVSLVGNDHEPLGPRVVVPFTVPAGAQHPHAGY